MVRRQTWQARRFESFESACHFRIESNQDVRFESNLEALSVPNDKVSNAEVNERTKLPDIPSLIADRRHSLFGHICRLSENTHALQALQLSIEACTSTPPTAAWKRPLGRSRRNWLQEVEGDIGLSVGAAQIAGQDRSMWRTLRPSAG